MHKQANMLFACWRSDTNQCAFFHLLSSGYPSSTENWGGNRKNWRRGRAKMLVVPKLCFHACLRHLRCPNVSTFLSLYWWPIRQCIMLCIIFIFGWREISFCLTVGITFAAETNPNSEQAHGQDQNHFQATLHRGRSTLRFSFCKEHRGCFGKVRYA